MVEMKIRPSYLVSLSSLLDLRPTPSSLSFCLFLCVFSFFFLPDCFKTKNGTRLVVISVIFFSIFPFFDSHLFIIYTN